MGTSVRRWDQTQTWATIGRPTVLVPPNPERIIGTTKITAGIAGLAYTGTTEASLTTVTGNPSYGSAYNGMTIRGKRFTGTPSVTALGLTFEDCYFNPADVNSIETNALNCDNDTVRNLVLRNCKLRPSGFSWRMYSIRGKNFTLEGCDVSGFQDLVSAVGKQASRVDLNVNLYGNYFHDQYYGLDPQQSDGSTHNDGIQIHYGGNNIDIFGNTYMGTCDQGVSLQGVPTFSGNKVLSGNRYYPHEPVPISWVMGSPTGSYSPFMQNFKFRNNWAGGASVGINWPHNDGVGIEITGNRWGLGTYTGDSNPSGGLPDDGNFFILMLVGQSATVTGNTYEASGTAYNGRHNG